MTDRNYITEMDAQIRDAIDAETDWVPAVVARKLLASADPDLVDGWLHAMAADFLTLIITRRERAHRSVERARAGSRVFAAAIEDGEEDALAAFSVTYAIDGHNTRRRVADMTGADHLFVAGSYQASANARLLLAEFHRQVAKQVKRKRTADVFTEAAYARLYHSIIGGAGETAA